ncbi:hypothetical protein [Brenneria corticis]|uniref:Uncharacterized protein n=1 Tax=Brenneria corticis TaxID=2173106 RepID=A0A2U1U1A5_9GAMM|nr:hypothetical protein [Brenneria sp. CFCC 11842]PWC15427.1 hypothetical protein DDT56_11875 [Brenneria sp. CFCC 11842]
MDAKTLAISVADGIASLPMDFYLGLERTFQDLSLSDGGRNIQRRNFNDDARFYRTLVRLFKNQAVLKQVADLIINNALSNLPDSALKRISDKLIGSATAMASRSATQLAVSGYLGSKVVGGMMATTISKLSLRLWTGSLVGGVVLQGVLSRAADASRRLSLENPELWRALYVNDFDMLYFLFEKPLENFIELGDTLRKNPAKTEQLLREIENL